MRKLSLIFFSVLLLVFSFSTALAKQEQELPSNTSGIPEKNGDYPDPEHPGIRVRVFVHEPKLPISTTTTCSDPDSTSIVHPAGWKLPSGTWTYNLNPSSAPASVGSANFPTIAANGFGAWQLAQNKVTFVRGADTTTTRSAFDGQNIIAWGRTLGTALAVTYIRYNTSTNLVVDVDTIMNQKFLWSWTIYSAGICGDPNSYDAQDILTHEQGHWLGLDDEYDSSYLNNTMFGYGSKGEIKKDTLTTGDISGVQAIYP